MESKDISKKLGIRIKELRLSKKIKQGELADMLDMERSNLTRIENGKQHPNIENLIKISKILNVEIKDLYNFDHIKPRHILIKSINSSLKSLTDKEIQYIYKSIENLKQVNK